MADDGWVPYPRYVGRLVVIRDRTGKEYQGILRFWKIGYIKLESESEEIIISRQEGNIVSLKGPRLPESPRDAKVEQNSQGNR